MVCCIPLQHDDSKYKVLDEGDCRWSGFVALSQPEKTQCRGKASVLSSFVHELAAYDPRLPLKQLGLVIADYAVCQKGREATGTTNHLVRAVSCPSFALTPCSKSPMVVVVTLTENKVLFLPKLNSTIVTVSHRQAY